MLKENFKGQAKKFLYVNRKAPYGTIYALESLEVVLLAPAFNQEVSLVFLDDGVFQIKKAQDTQGVGMKNFSPTYRALHDYGVKNIYVEKASLTQRGLNEDDLLVPVQLLNTQQLSDLMEQQDVILSF